MVNVLFVDDNQVFLETFTELCAVFSNQTWGIKSAVSADCALAILRQKPIDLVVLDLGMPLIDGTQLLGMLKQYYPAIKIAVMTGNAADDKRLDTLARGADLFIEKPVTPGGIRAAFNLLNDLVLASQRKNSSDAACPDDFVAVATHDGEK